MASITLNFNELKYNLYEILNVEQDASENKIKKAFRNLVLNFHPDKNKKTEEEIYYHIITANQILTNPEFRNKYNDFINKKSLTHDELKKNINTFIKNEINSGDALSDFKKKNQDLDNKHLNGFNYNNMSYNEIKQKRENEINIDFENIHDDEHFNTVFENKLSNGTFSKQLITIPENNKLAITNVGDNYTSLDLAFNNLYVEDGSISTSKFSSLDLAFSLLPVNNRIVTTNNDSYVSNDEYLKNIKYNKDKFEYW